MTGRHAERAGERVNVQSPRWPDRSSARDTGLLASPPAARRRRCRIVGLLAVTRRAAASGRTAGAASAARWVPVWSSTSADAVTWPGTHARMAGVLAGEHERQHRVPQRVLRGIWRGPTVQQCLDDRVVQGSLADQQAVGRHAGSRGPDGSARGSRSRWRPTVPSPSGSSSSARTRSGGEDRRPDPAAADVADGQRDQQRLHGRADRDGEHGVLGGGAGRRPGRLCAPSGTMNGITSSGAS